MKPDHDKERQTHLCERCDVDLKENTTLCNCWNDLHQDNLYQIYRFSICQIRTCVVIPFIIFGILWVASLKDLDRIEVPCVNEIVWATIDDSCSFSSGYRPPCVHSYRRKQWHINGSTYGYNVNIGECSWKGVPHPECDLDYTLAWARAHWLNVAEICMVHADSFESWTSNLTPDDSPAWLPNRVYGIITLCFLLGICATFYCEIAMVYRRKRAKRFELDIPGRHAFYIDDFVPFLAAAKHKRLRTKDTALDVFVRDPLYDGINMPRLIGQFVDAHIKFAGKAMGKAIDKAIDKDFVGKIYDNHDNEEADAYQKSDLMGNFHYPV